MVSAALWDLDEFLPGTLIPYVRTEPTPEEYQGQRFLPREITNDLKFEYILGARNRPVMAHVMAFDSEAPIGSRQKGGESVQGKLPPIKRKMMVGEEEMIRFLQPRNGTNDQQQAVLDVYRDLSDLTQSVLAREEWLIMKALSEDKVIYNEDGVIFEFDFGLDNELQWDLTSNTNGDGTVLGGDQQLSGTWENTATSDPVNDLAFFNRVAVRKTGRRFVEFVTDDETIDLARRSASLHLLARGENGLPGILTEEEVNSVLTRYQVPRLTSYNVYLDREDAAGNIISEKVLRDGRGFLVPQGQQVGTTKWGPTAESRVLIGTELSTQMPGLFAGTYTTDEPPASWTKVAAVLFPNMPYAQTLGQAQVRAERV